MNTYQITLKETVYGFAFVNADSEAHAREIAETIMEHGMLNSLADVDGGIDAQEIENIVPLTLAKMGDELATLNSEEQNVLQLNMEEYAELLSEDNASI